MPPWTPPALGGAVFIAAHYLLLRAASGKIGDRLGAFVLEGSATLGLAASLIVGRWLEHEARGGLPRDAVATTGLGVGFAAASGLVVSVASVLLFASLRRGGPVASTGTIVLGGGVALSALFAPLLFGESLTLRRALGVALGLAAMWVLAGET
ncbi:MAG: hypothetical protein ACREJ3_10930 [Polyangiaceae bacterium]